MRFLSLTALALSAALATSALAQSSTMVWNVNRYSDEATGAPLVVLVYGVPQTDDVRASLWCQTGEGYSFAVLDLSADIRAYNGGERVPVALTAPGHATGSIATVFRHEEGIWGLSLALPLDDPLFTAMLAEGSLGYSLPGGTREAIPLAGLATALPDFRSTCAAAAGRRAK